MTKVADCANAAPKDTISEYFRRWRGLRALGQMPLDEDSRDAVLWALEHLFEVMPDVTPQSASEFAMVVMMLSDEGESALPDRLRSPELWRCAARLAYSAVRESARV